MCCFCGYKKLLNHRRSLILILSILLSFTVKRYRF